MQIKVIKTEIPIPRPYEYSLAISELSSGEFEVLKRMFRYSQVVPDALSRAISSCRSWSNEELSTLRCVMRMITGKLWEN